MMALFLISGLYESVSGEDMKRNIHALNAEAEMALTENVIDALPPGNSGKALVGVFVKIVRRYNNRRGYAWPGHENIAKQLKVSTRTVTTSIKRLEEAGAIECIGGGYGRKAKEYRPVFHPTYTALQRIKFLYLFNGIVESFEGDIRKVIDSLYEHEYRPFREVFSKDSDPYDYCDNDQLDSDSPFLVDELEDFLNKLHQRDKRKTPLEMVYDIYRSTEFKGRLDEVHFRDWLDKPQDDIPKTERRSEVGKAKGHVIEILNGLNFMVQKFSPPELYF